MVTPRARGKVGPVRIDDLAAEDRLLLEVGPAPRLTRRPGWPATEARLAGLWRVHRAQLLAQPGQRPWGFLRFDVPEHVRRPGPVRDALVARGVLGADEVALHDASPSRSPRPPRREPTRRRPPASEAR